MLALKRHNERRCPFNWGQVDVCIWRQNTGDRRQNTGDRSNVASRDQDIWGQVKR